MSADEFTEVSATRRAGCKAKRCKDNDVKIQKGELRMGVLVDFDGEHQSMVWRHWSVLITDHNSVMSL